MTKNCLYCGKEFEVRDTNNRQKFCSKKCRSKNQGVKRYPLETVSRKCRLCGEEFSVRAGNNYKIFCSKLCANNSFQKGKYINNPKYRFNEYIRNARRRDIAFNLTYEYFIEHFWHAECSYCGSEIETAGIDRVDSSIGYEIDNCVPCCTKCNMMKQAHSPSDFLSHIQKIINHTAGAKSADSSNS